MAKKPKPRTEDEEQSRRFIETAKGLEAAGELSPTEDGSALEKLMGKVVPPKRRPT